MGTDLKHFLDNFKEVKEIINWACEKKVGEFTCPYFSFKLSSQAYVAKEPQEVVKPKLVTQLEREKAEQEEDSIKFWSA